MTTVLSPFHAERSVHAQRGGAEASGWRSDPEDIVDDAAYADPEDLAEDDSGRTPFPLEG